MTEQINVPKLRFGEFTSSWVSSKLGKLSAIRSASRVHREQWTDTGVPFFRSSDVVAAYKGSDNNKAFISYDLFEELSEKSGKPKKDDLLVTGGGSIGIPYLIPNDEPLYFKDADLLWFKNKKALDGYFLYEFLITSKFRRYLASITHTGTISHYTIEQAKSTPITLPELAEQQKIASFLSKVDEKIALLTEKKVKLTEYKKGVMQQLFNGKWQEQDGKLVFVPPTLRFKADDGSEFPDWERIGLGKLAKKSSTKNKENNVNIVLTNSATQGIISQNDYFQKDIANQDNLDGYYVVDINDFVYNPRISVSAPVGPINRNKISQGVMSPLYTVFTVTGNVSLSYLELFFKTTFWHKYMSSIANFGARHDRMNVTSKDFFNMPVPIPFDAEQQKIVNFIEVLEQRLKLTENELEKAKEWKKGLLQQMFV